MLAWLLGLLAMSLKMLGGLLYVQRLRRYRVEPLGEVWQARLGELCARAGLRRPVQLLESALVRGPLVVGHLRPVVLVPLGAVAGLPPACLEAILAHEVAHVLRRDYLVNLLQTAVEVLFFYHPAVWFMTGCLRDERENCCDDAATALVGGDPLRLARALTALAEWSHSAVLPAGPRLALAATGGRGTVLGRVRRLVLRRPTAPSRAQGVLALLLVLSGLALLSSSFVLAGPLVRPGNSQNQKAGATPGESLGSATADTSKRQRRALVSRDSAGASRVERLAGGRARIRLHGMNVEFDTLLNPHLMRPGNPGTIIIEKDKKGRLTKLVVNGQRIEAATVQPSKAERKAGKQVTVVPLPPAPPLPPVPPRTRRIVSFGYDQPTAEASVGYDDKTRRQLERAERKVNRELRKAGSDYVYETPNLADAPRRSRNNIHIEIDEQAILRLTDNALALGEESVNFGLEAAALGLAEARRELQKTLRDPGLDTETRREIERDLKRLDRDQDEAARESAQERRADALQRQVDARVRQADALQRQADARQRQADARQRQAELRERIEEAQRELRELEAEQPAGALPPRAPHAPRTPRVPSAPRAAQAPPAPPVDNSGKVRDALRADGLIGKRDKSFRFELKDGQMTVNGQRQSAATAEKYRKLLGLSPDSKGRQSAVTINFSEKE